MSEGAVDLGESTRSDAVRRWSTTEKWLAGPLLILAIALPLLRQTGNHSWNTLLVEDAYFYSQQAEAHGLLDLLFQGHRGYLILPIRVLVLPAVLLPISQLARYAAVAGAVTCALLALFVYHASRQWVSSRPVRLALASLVVLMPAAGYENAGNITNTIWAFAAAAPWAIVSLEERRRDIASRSVVVFLAAASLPLGFLLLPMALAYLWWRRTAASWIVTASLVVGIVAQAVVTLITPSGFGTPDRPAAEVADLLLVKSVAVYTTGSRAAVELWRSFGLVPAFLCLLLVVGLFSLALAGVERRERVLAGAFLTYGFVGLFLLIWWRGTLTWRYGAPFDVESQMRYSVPVTLMIASAFAVLVAPSDKRARNRVIAAWGRPVLVLQICVVMLLSFSVSNYRSSATPWPTMVADARKRCDRMVTDQEVAVTPPGSLFVIRARCSELRS